MNTKLKCILLDDELPGLTYLKMLCEQIKEVEVVKAFNDPNKLLKEISDLDFDVCILDIEMPGISGLEVAKSLKDKQIIFTTAYKEFAAEAFDLDAIDYIRKPIQKERLEKAIEKVILKLNTSLVEKKYVQLNTNKGKTRLFVNDVLYIKTSEIDSRDKSVFFKDGSNLTLKNITYKELEKILPEKEFIRINKQEILSLKSIHSFSFDTITTNILLPGGQPQTFALNEAYRNAFTRKING